MQFDLNSYFFKVIMVMTKEYIRHILLYKFNKGNNAMESARNIKATNGESDNKRKPMSTVIPEIPSRKP